MKIKRRFVTLHDSDSHIKLKLHPSAERKIVAEGSSFPGPFECNEISHKQLAQYVEQVSRTLHTLVPEGGTVLCCTRLGIPGLVVLLAALRNGLRVCPVDAGSGSVYLDNMMQRLTPVLCITEGALQHRLARSPVCQMIDMSVCFSSVHAVTSSQEPPHLLFHRKAELLTASSGSTGKAKIIRYDMQRFTEFMNYHDFLFRQFPDSSGTRVFGGPLVCTTPLFHLGGLALCLQACILGKTLFMLNDSQSETIIDLARVHDVELLMMIPGMLRLVIREQMLAVGCHRLRYCLTFGEAVDKSLVQEVRRKTGMQVYSAYGMSEGETGFGHARATIVSGNAPAGNCGQHLFGDICLCDEYGQSVDDEGELWVRNSSVGPCYTDLELNKKCYQQGWFRTGDILRRDENGFYYYQGRADQMMIVSGKNIYPAEIEEMLTRHPQVSRVKVVSLTKSDGSVCPAALLELSDNAEISPDRLLDHYLQHGNVAGAPGWLKLCRSLPELANGKVDVEKCRAILEQDYRRACKSAGRLPEACEVINGLE